MPTRKSNLLGCSTPFAMFGIGLVVGYALAAVGEGYIFSPGTCIGAVVGGIFGLWLGLLMAAQR
jgi:hypothetical protein